LISRKPVDVAPTKYETCQMSGTIRGEGRSRNKEKDTTEKTMKLLPRGSVQVNGNFLKIEYRGIHIKSSKLCESNDTHRKIPKHVNPRKKELSN
jgi:hypothetical protein